MAWPVPRDRRQNWTYAHDRSGRVSDEDAVPYPPLASRVNRSIRELPNLRRLSLNLEGFTEAQNEYIIDVMSYAQPWVQVDHLRVIASEETEAAIIEHSRVRTPGTQSRLRSLQMSHGMRSQGYLQARRHHGNLERLYINLRFDRGRQDGRHCELYNILDHENPDPDDENEPVSLDPLLDADYVTPTGPNDPYSLSRTLRTMRPIQLRLIARHFPRLQWLVITEQAPPEFFPSTLRGPSFVSVWPFFLNEHTLTPYVIARLYQSRHPGAPAVPKPHPFIFHGLAGCSRGGSPSSAPVHWATH